MLTRANLILASASKIQARRLNTDVARRATKNPSGNDDKAESERMKKFHDKLKSDTGPSGTPGMEFDDLVLVETDQKSGDAVANHEKDPTKWGDWQHGGRVSDF